MITAEIIKSASSSNWEALGQQIFSIERSVFAEKAFSEEMLKSDINDSKVVLAILKDDNSIIGFAYALPEDEHVSCIVDIAIIKGYQNKGLVAILMPCLEEELKRGGYEYMIEYAIVENGYADKIQKNYASRIIESKDIVGEYGKQRYFKIRL